MRPDGVQDHGPLTHQQVARPVQDQHALLIFRLDRNEAHVRPRHRLADRLGVGGVVLLPLHVRLHIGRRDQPHLMPERRDLARPVVGGGAGLHAHKAGFKLREKIQHSAPPQFLLQNHRSLGVDAVKLKDGFGQIDPECRNMHGGRLLPTVG
jgi:hypothetical protein